MPSSRLAVIVGAPRSGTTWLQQLLASHQLVTSPQETHLFDKLLAPMFAEWKKQQDHVEMVLAALERGEVPDRRLVGLPTILTDDKFRALGRAYVDAVVEAALAAKPGAELVIEKTPSNSLHVELIDELVPDVRFVHIIRDPVDVVASLMHAAQGWGSPWAPARPMTAARIWRRHVTAARRASGFGDRYCEIRYENLRADPVAELTSVFDFVGVPADPQLCHDFVGRAKSGGSADVEGYALPDAIRSRIVDPSKLEPEGFARKDGGRRRPLSQRDRLAVAFEAEELMGDLGYADTDGRKTALGRAARRGVSAVGEVTRSRWPRAR